MSFGLFVTGTDTHVGKTLITCGIACLLRRWNVRVGVMKPVATGDRRDAKDLMRAAGVDDPIETVNPQFFNAPLAPLISAAREKRRLQWPAIRQAYRRLQKRYDVLLVEGVGGVRVPLASSKDVRDLIALTGLPTLIVGRAALGTLNHTLLTLDALCERSLPVAGVLFNGRSLKEKNLAEQTNGDALGQCTAVPFLGHIPADPRFRRATERLADAMERLPAFVAMLRKTCVPT